MLGYLNAIPARSAHEHIGSIDAFGMDDFRGFAVDARRDPPCGGASLLSLALDPYMSAHVARALGGPIPRGGADGVWRKIVPALARMTDAGVFRALDAGCESLYGVPVRAALADAEAYYELDSKIRKAYEKGLAAHTRAAFGKANIERALRPVQIRYLLESDAPLDPDAPDAPILRVDELTDFLFLRGGAAERAEAIYGVAPVSARSLDHLIDLAFALVDKYHIPAVKNLIAYTRAPGVAPRTRAEAERALNTWDWRKIPEAARCVQDYALTRVLEEANARGVAFQMHIGMAGQPDGNPMGLCRTIEAYPNVKFVLLHGYPYLSEMATLAWRYPNVTVDAAWLAICSGAVFEKAMTEWIGFAPASSICLSADATSAEQCVGAYEVMREGLARVLEQKIADRALTPNEAAAVGARLLRGNCLALYGQ